MVADCRQPPQGDKPYALAGIAVKVLPYLSKADAQAVLAAARTLGCFQDLPAGQALWPVLLHHVAEGNATAFGSVAEQLLEQGQGATDARAQYLLGMALLGRLRASDLSGAQAVWMKYQSTLGKKPLHLGLEILRDHALSGQSGGLNRQARNPAPG